MKPLLHEEMQLFCINYVNKLNRIVFFQVFVFFLSFLVTLQQAVTSGYINSVITTIEKRFDIPSSLSGLIASSYEIGNVITVIFVSYLGSRRHIPIWIGIGELPPPSSESAVLLFFACLDLNKLNKIPNMLVDNSIEQNIFISSM